MSQASATPTALPHDAVLHGANVKRLMARFDMTLADVVQATGLDERTVRSLLRGATRPHARTLHKLAAGLGIDVDELFHDPREAQAAFDRESNPAVARIIQEQAHLFANWTQSDFNELFSRVGVGGELTDDGALAAACAMNRRRELMKQVAIILETPEADLLREFIALLYRRATAMPADG